MTGSSLKLIAMMALGGALGATPVWAHAPGDERADRPDAPSILLPTSAVVTQLITEPSELATEPVLLAQREGYSEGDYEPERVPQTQRQASGLPYEDEIESVSALPSEGAYTGSNSLLPPAATYTGVYDPAGLITVDSDKVWFGSLSQTVDYVKDLALPISVDPSNSAAFGDDWQFQTNAAVQRHVGDEEQAWDVYFNYYQALHPKVTALDLQIFTVGTTYQYLLDDNLVGAITYDYSYFFLDHDSLLSRHRIGPTLSYQVDNCVNYQLSYFYLDNNYRNNPAETSDTNVVQIQRVQYMDAAHNDYWTIGYAAAWNDAVSESSSYQLNQPFAGVRWLAGCELRNEVLLLGSYGHYSFDGFDILEPTIEREDNIYTVSGRLTHAYTDHFSVFAQYIYLNSDSNVARQSYESHLWSLGATVAF